VSTAARDYCLRYGIFVHGNVVFAGMPYVHVHVRILFSRRLEAVALCWICPVCGGHDCQGRPYWQYPSSYSLLTRSHLACENTPLSDRAGNLAWVRKPQHRAPHNHHLFDTCRGPQCTLTEDMKQDHITKLVHSVLYSRSVICNLDIW
jgi:hypothetical protein